MARQSKSAAAEAPEVVTEHALPNGHREAPPVEPGHDAPPDDDDEPIADAPQPTIHARLRREERDEKEREEIADIHDNIRAKLDLDKYSYKFRLHRVLPEFQNGINVTGLLKTYDHLPELDEIAAEHGGLIYDLYVVGPDIENPKKTKTQRHRLPRIAGPAKTVSTPDGALPLSQLPAPATTNGFETVVGKMMEMFAKQAEESRKDAKALIDAALSKANASPTVNPLDIEKFKAAEEEKKRQHDMLMKKMEQDAEDRRERERQAAEDRREQDRMRLEAEKLRRAQEDSREKDRQEESRRQHEREMKRIEADSARAIEDAKAARAESERRHQELIKTLGENKKKEDQNPEERLLTTIELVDRIRGKEDSKEDKTIKAALAETITKVPDKLESILTKWNAKNQSEKTAKKEPDAKPTHKPGTTGVIDVPAEKVEAPAADPTFEWPANGIGFEETAKMLGRNVEKALEARWPTQRIFSDMLVKFPDWLRDAMAVTSTDDIIKMMEANAPADAHLRSLRGKAAVRVLHGLVRREKKLKQPQPEPDPQKKEKTDGDVPSNQ